MTARIATSVVDTFLRRFDEALNRSGYRTLSSGERPSEWRWAGKARSTRENVEITVSDAFPYSSPDVRLVDRPMEPMWHRARDGALCLWDSHSKGDLPWLDVARLEVRVDEWIARAAAGWSDDLPQLDLEAYFDPHLVSVSGVPHWPLLDMADWDEVPDGLIRVSHPNAFGRMSLLEMPAARPGAITPNRRAARGGSPRHREWLDAIRVDLGALEAPAISRRELVTAMGSADLEIGRLLIADCPVLVIARYTRSDSSGFIGFWLIGTEPDAPVETFQVAESVGATRRRAGWHAGLLGDRTVAVVGVGSVGSHVAELLHRSGVRSITLLDDDVLLPGNVVRHVCDEGVIGCPKAVALAALLNRRAQSDSVEHRDSLRTFDAAVDVLGSTDLVIDCTGDRMTGQLLVDASTATGARFLRASVEGHGQFARVDVIPPFANAEPLGNDGVKVVDDLEFEGGCGDPVSPTPPTAVVEVSAIAARLALSMLVGERITQAGERRPLFDEPRSR